MTAAIAVAPAIYQKLDARYVAGRKYRLASPFEYASALPGIGRFIIPATFLTNFHSTPRILWPILPPDDWAESAVGHDAAYRYAGVLDYQVPPEILAHFLELAPDARAVLVRRLRHEQLWRDVTREQADQLHRELLIHCGASERRANWMYRGLRVGGWKSWWEYRHGRISNSVG